jgi:hypothetical protein
MNTGANECDVGDENAIQLSRLIRQKKSNGDNSRDANHPFGVAKDMKNLCAFQYPVLDWMPH